MIIRSCRGARWTCVQAHLLKSKSLDFTQGNMAQRGEKRVKKHEMNKTNTSELQQDTETSQKTNHQEKG